MNANESTTPREAAIEQLNEWGLYLVGKSNKSSSRYYGLSPDEEDTRLRISDHAVAYQSSDCAVCVGSAPDDDFGFDDIADAVKSLVLKTIADDTDDEANYLWREAADESLDPSDFSDEARREVLEQWRCYGNAHARRWVCFVPAE